MTEAAFNNFIMSFIRKGSTRWKPIQDVQKKARAGRGVYWCVGWGGQERHKVPVTAVIDGKRKKNVVVDHIIPAKLPNKEDNDWQSVIDRMFVEVDGLQVLCQACHRIKTNEEISERAAFRRQQKEELNDTL